MKLALATGADVPDLSEDDRLLLPCLAAAGVDAVPVVWSDPSADWSDFDGIWIRSTYDYIDDVEGFLAWALARSVPVLNPAWLVRWNADKRYLIDLARRSVPVVPTRFATTGAEVHREARALGAEDVVIKPAVSCGSRDTYRLSAEEALERSWGDQVWLVQPFLPEVIDDGEWSLHYADGVLSHTVCKRAAVGDFRVQEMFGGAVASVRPDAALRGVAEQALDALPERPVVARVDLVRTAAGPRVMEVELIEPSLYLAHHPPAAATFTEAVLGRLQARS